MNMEERPSQVIEEYLLVLYKLQRDGEKAKSVTLANSLDTSAPTVHATVGRMQRDGLIKVNRSKEIQLTQLGFEMAENIAYRHNLAEDFLCNTLGIPWFEVHKHAHQLEHAMTPLVVEKLAEFLGKPEFCPHGTPMPGQSLHENSFTLDQAQAGSSVKVAMIGEDLEDSVELMRVLQNQQMMPGHKHTILERSEVMQSITLDNGNGPSVLPMHVAQKIIVIPSPALV